MCKICVLCEKLWRKQHHLRIDVLYIRSIWNEQRIQWVQLDRLKEAFKCNDTYLHLQRISCASLIRVTDAHLKFECNVLFDENLTNIRNWILFLTALLSMSLLHHLQWPLDFRSTSPLQPIILHPWPVCLLSAKPLCRDFLPGSVIVTQIHPVVFLFIDFECIYFSAGGRKGVVFDWQKWKSRRSMTGSRARRDCEIKAKTVYRSLTGIFESLSLKHLCFNQSFHCHNFNFFLCLTTHQPAPSVFYSLT